MVRMAVNDWNGWKRLEMVGMAEYSGVKYLLKQRVNMKNYDWDDLHWDSVARAFTIQILWHIKPNYIHFYNTA